MLHTSRGEQVVIVVLAVGSARPFEEAPVADLEDFFGKNY